MDRSGGAILEKTITLHCMHAINHAFSVSPVFKIPGDFAENSLAEVLPYPAGNRYSFNRKKR
jgi:hypothetical protein